MKNAKNNKATDAIEWLRGQKDEVKFYWLSRDYNIEIAASGVALQISSFDELSTFIKKKNKEIRLYGGLKFEKIKKSAENREFFSDCFFFVPEKEIIITKKQTVDESLKEKTAKPKKKIRYLDFDIWKRNALKILKLIKSKSIKKIVLAKKTKIKNKKTNIFHMLKEMKEDASNDFLFLFQLRKNHVFIGRPPELLFRKIKQIIQTEAMAGTAQRGKSKIEEAFYVKNLAASKKENIEHLIVKKYIKRKINNLCVFNKENENKKIIKLNNVQHLKSSIYGYIKKNINEGDILTNMHPTPAVCGAPADKAKKIINNIEGFNRGHYSAPIGFISHKITEFAVALRSMLLVEKTMHLFAGAGIVKESTPKKEWDETEYKIKSIKNICQK